MRELPRGLLYDPDFVSRRERAELVRALAALRPIWERRYSDRRARNGEQRALLRPVYWLGSWQFACLDYYRPPARVRDCCVAAEPFPPALARLVRRIERIARELYQGVDLPRGWKLNVCLVNLYGARLEGTRLVDCARVGEHRDFEPGPVASLSLGERALFQFVRPSPSATARRSRACSFARPDGRAARASRLRSSKPAAALWLEDRSLLLFGGEPWKSRLLHRVLRVERRGGHSFPLPVPGFETRRVNLTLRYVPDEHVVPFAALAPDARDDVREYVTQLAHHSDFFARALREERPPA